MAKRVDGEVTIRSAKAAEVAGSEGQDKKSDEKLATSSNYSLMVVNLS